MTSFFSFSYFIMKLISFLLFHVKHNKKISLMCYFSRRFFFLSFLSLYVYIIHCWWWWKKKNSGFDEAESLRYVETNHIKLLYPAIKWWNILFFSYFSTYTYLLALTSFLSSYFTSFLIINRKEQFLRNWIFHL
jgi:hypothetical protein